jgi:hypothetical protein
MTQMAITSAYLCNNKRSNHLKSAVCNPCPPSRIGETFIFIGGAPSQVVTNDDSTDFKDAYLETGRQQTLNQAVTIDRTDYYPGSKVESEFLMMAGTGSEVFVIRINGKEVGFSYPVGQYPMPGEAFTCVDERDGIYSDSSEVAPESGEQYAGVACFGEGALIGTPRGVCKVEDLEIGDMVRTLDRGSQPIRWLHRNIQPLDTGNKEDAFPILIKAGALGEGLPVNHLIVSPQLRILVGGKGQLQDQYKREVFTPAKSLIYCDKIRRIRSKREILWVHFACDQKEVVYANSCLSESLVLGPLARKGMTG